jgi:hypothetical protein
LACRHHPEKESAEGNDMLDHLTLLQSSGVSR